MRIERLDGQASLRTVVSYQATPRTVASYQGTPLGVPI
jgi:hypothetical protein